MARRHMQQRQPKALGRRPKTQQRPDCDVPATHVHAVLVLPHVLCWLQPQSATSIQGHSDPTKLASVLVAWHAGLCVSPVLQAPAASVLARWAHPAVPAVVQ
jgi:hypothetical protein